TAEQLFQDALAIRRSLGISKSLAALLFSLGTLERKRKRYDAAEQYHREALEIFVALNGKQGVTSQYRGLGLIALECERWAEAREWFEKGLSLAREIGQQSLIARIQCDLACAHEAEGRYVLALPLAQEALVIEEKIRSRNLARTRELVERLKKKTGEQESPAQ